MLEVRTAGSRVLVKVRVRPKAARDAVVGEHEGALKVAVTAAPEKGKANKAVVEMLSRALRIPKSHVELVAGATSRDKTFAIRGTSREAIEALVNEERP